MNWKSAFLWLCLWYSLDVMPYLRIEHMTSKARTTRLRVRVCVFSCIKKESPSATALPIHELKICLPLIVVLSWCQKFCEECCCDYTDLKSRAGHATDNIALYCWSTAQKRRFNIAQTVGPLCRTPLSPTSRKEHIGVAHHCKTWLEWKFIILFHGFERVIRFLITI